ncbi:MULTISPECIES: hypothetical protein [unclassified Mesorhizobium]|uniref:hypothetical protein n=1 Tax=unclassified Mesorhizobium TaxID=325217 RepID=UPI001CCB79BA|nr:MULTISPECIES: hypothetical protein [unclassified Mesorhizobium]MBZ9734561.1 hypothetical protein [Mesorhizobium sp. CA9]MBZ9812114.1 hypothetical protein [Mesorhizobium sp. CA7]MBZ9826903.1 hypothetical protein [Mesorhizobium sp. CA18]MBZ9832475.1 hypothetical protein [Mesorhizobium sp. CA2]MBZ9838469.1 hypothetical protein [Mesorhizobium sp. CA3]
MLSFIISPAARTAPSLPREIDTIYVGDELAVVDVEIIGRDDALPLVDRPKPSGATLFLAAWQPEKARDSVIVFEGSIETGGILMKKTYEQPTLGRKAKLSAIVAVPPVPPPPP